MRFLKFALWLEAMQKFYHKSNQSTALVRGSFGFILAVQIAGTPLPEALAT
jgi:hypothetical protein